MKYTLRSKLILYFITTSIFSMIFLSLIINAVINKRFHQYMHENQTKRDREMVQYFEQIYLKEKKWQSTSGTEIIHQAMMEGYNLSLLDADKTVIWKMDKDMVALHHKMMGHHEGKYNQKTYPIQLEKDVIGYIVIGQYGDLIFSPEDLVFRKNIRLGLIFSFILSILLSLVIAMILSKQLANPIKKIRSAADRLKQGDLQTRVEINSDTLEIESLKESINHLGASLQEQELLRKQLTSDISHELRTPLNIMLSQMEAFIDGVWQPTAERLQGFHEEILRLTDLVKELEKLTSLEDQKIQLNKEQINLNHILQSVVENFKPKFYQKGIKLEYQPSKENIQIEADKSKLNQVLINILSNAYKFTDKDGSVRIYIKEYKEYYELHIQDTGRGIKQEDLTRIFERFYRGEKSRNRETGGAGIGLTIVKKIIEAHGWIIDVNSAERQGSVFIIKILK